MKATSIAVLRGEKCQLAASSADAEACPGGVTKFTLYFSGNSPGSSQTWL